MHFETVLYFAGKEISKQNTSPLAFKVHISEKTFDENRNDSYNFRANDQRTLSTYVNYRWSEEYDTQTAIPF